MKFNAPRLFAQRVEVAPGRRLFCIDAPARNAEAAAEDAVLFLHGFTGCGAAMAAAARAFAGMRRLYPDLHGHGKSDAPRDPAAYQLEPCVRDLQALLAARGVAKATLVGYSLGARVALGFALLAPRQTRAVIAIGARAGIANAQERAARIQADEALAARIESIGAARFALEWGAQPLFASQKKLPARAREILHRQRLANSARGLAASLRGVGAGAQPPLQKRLREIAAPLLLLTGAEDAPRFHEAAREIAAAAPRAQTAVLPGAGHAAHLEAPRAFARAVHNFIRREKA